MFGTIPNPTTEEIENIKNLYHRKFSTLINHSIDDAHWLNITHEILALKNKKGVRADGMLILLLNRVTGEDWNSKLSNSNPIREVRRASEKHDVAQASEQGDGMIVKRTRYDALLAPSCLYLRENPSITTVSIEDAAATERCKTPIQAMLEPFGVQTVTLTTPPRPINEPIKTWNSPNGSRYRLFRESADHKEGALFEKVSPKKTPTSVLPPDLADERLSEIREHYQQTNTQINSINKEGILTAAKRIRACSQKALTGARCQQVFEAENCAELLSAPKKSHWAHLIGHQLDATGQLHHASNLIPATAESNLRTLGAFEQPIKHQLLTSRFLKKVDMAAAPVYSGDSLIPVSVKNNLDWRYEFDADEVEPSVTLTEVIHINPRSTKPPNSNDFKALNTLRYSEFKMKSHRKLFESDNSNDESISVASSLALVSEQAPLEAGEFNTSQSSTHLSSRFYNLSSTNSSDTSTPARTDTPSGFSQRCSSQLDSSEFSGSQPDAEHDHAVLAPGSQIE